MEETCAWCIHHIWSDSLSYHICAKIESDEQQYLTETCPQWRKSNRLTGAKDKE